MKYQNDDFLLNELKEEFKSIEAPNLSKEIKARYIMKQAKQKRKINLHYLFRPAIGLLAILVFVLLIIISEHNIKAPINIPLNEKYHQEITFKSLSAINLLPLDNSSDEVIPLSKTSEQEIDDIHKYMLFVEQSLSSSILTKTLKSDNKEYKYKDQITMTTPLGQVYEYVFYYNLSTTSIQDDEQEYKINGLMLFEGNQYILRGEHEVEGNEYKTTFIAELNKNNWVRIVLEIEDDEQSYLYEIYNNGSTSKMKFEIENDDNQAEVKLTIEENQTKNQYKFQKETHNNQTQIKVKTNEENIKVYIVFDKNNNPIYEYFIENSNQKIQKEPHKKHQGPQGPQGPQGSKDSKGPKK